MKVAPFVNRGYTKGVSCSWKMVYKTQGVWSRSGASPYKHLFSTPTHPRKQSPCVELWGIWNGFWGGRRCHRNIMLPGRLIYHLKLSHKSLCHWLLCFDCILLVRWWCQVRTIIMLVMYSETCIKRTPSIKRTVAKVPKFISLIYFKWNLY